MIPAGRLTLDDLEGLAFRYGGTIEPRPGNRYVLVGTVIDGRTLTLGPVPADVADLAVAVTS